MANTVTETPAIVDHAVERQCPICGDEKRAYMFVVNGLHVCRCPQCELLLLHPPPSHADIASFYFGKSPEDRTHVPDSQTEIEASERYLNELKLRGLTTGKLLILCARNHPIAAAAKSRGYEVTVHAPLNDDPLKVEKENEYDAALILHQLEKAAEPGGVLDGIHGALKKDGLILTTTPSIESWPCRTLGPRWTEWRPENRYYFDHLSIQTLLIKHGFGQIWIEPDRRLYTLEHIYRRAKVLPRSLATRLISLVYWLAYPLSKMRMRFSCSGIIVSGRKALKRDRPLVSVIVPAYNEKDTFNELMTELVKKEIPGANKEIIIVESNSKDGTRDIARSFLKHPEVRLILQDKPSGKGNAVRAGLRQATGDVVLIQDADLEYDLNDYDALVEPILKHRASFVLGARHGGNWKMRQFADNNSLATYLNVGHLFFAFLVNFLFRQSMRDPFTMFKVFRRDCLYGIEFTCNRFDFDFELVIRLVQKGYTPIELPVNYRSRSFQEGKKVRMIRDPLTWIWVCCRLWLNPLKRKIDA